MCCVRYNIRYKSQFSSIQPRWSPLSYPWHGPGKGEKCRKWERGKGEKRKEQAIWMVDFTLMYTFFSLLLRFPSYEIVDRRRDI